MIPQFGQTDRPLWADWYRLEGRTPVPCRSEEDMASIWENNRVVRYDELPGGVVVSTVFLGLDHSFTRDGPPILFETMIFNGPHDGEQWRYATWEEAALGHDEALTVARGE